MELVSWPRALICGRGLAVTEVRPVVSMMAIVAIWVVLWNMLKKASEGEWETSYRAHHRRGRILIGWWHTDWDTGHSLIPYRSYDHNRSCARVHLILRGLSGRIEVVFHTFPENHIGHGMLHSYWKLLGKSLAYVRKWCQDPRKVSSDHQGESQTAAVCLGGI